MKVSVVIPALNEEKGIGVTLDHIQKHEFSKKNWDLEILVVDGGSQDKTPDIVREKGGIVIKEPRKGYGRAYKTGFTKATGDIIVTGDADATYPFNEIHLYITELINHHLDFITTNRFAQLGKGSMSLKHYLGNFILSFTLRVLFGVRIKDSQSGMWIFHRHILDKISLEKMDDGMPFSEEIKIDMFKKSTIRAREIPSRLSAREGEAKIQSFGDGWKNFKFLFKKKWST
jgi:glycosyltransferase involved in cell wall biosynthesis